MDHVALDRKLFYPTLYQRQKLGRENDEQFLI
jgi:hypothetical protein